MITGLFGVARSALLTHQTSLQVVSQNVANAETPGYSRQRPVLSASLPVRMPNGNIGTGVQLAGIARQRDALLDAQFRSATTLLGESQYRQNALSQIEDIFGEPSDAGMAAALDQFWSAFSELGTLPGSEAARTVVQQRGRQLTQLFNDYDTRLTQQRTQSLTQLNATVATVNQLATQVAELNGRITASEAGNTVASELRDRRDLLLDDLARIAGARVEPQRDGSVSVMLANSTLVEGINARTLRLDLDPAGPPSAVTPSDVPVMLRLGNSPDRLAPLSGELRAMVDVINADIPTLRSRLDTMASALVGAVNTIHQGGFLFPGGTVPGVAAGAFFDAGTVLAPVRAGTIRLADAIAANAGNIATSGNATAPLDNSVALALSALRNNTDAISWTGPGGATETAGFNGFFRTTVTRLGLDQRSASDDALVRTTLVDQAETRRQAVSGVSTDEELIMLMRIQQSYAAATKLIKTADEMLQTILSLV
jgi:flagellar hook-associated protein 1 FlgK